MLPSWCSDTLQVFRAPLINERGAMVFDWDNAESHDISGCSVQPSTSNTSNDEPRVNQFYDSLMAYIPDGADIKPGDRVEFLGKMFEVNGDVMWWRSPTGALSHGVVYLRSWNG
jgi:hypothetical protein|nr:MAG TPA: Minor capsid protein [Caudoviricetes sp.]